ncbi:MAG: hypothetical protein JWM52_474 [Candidatus Saccharibacteria bacterium]|nr:hypothetical protein [Candidatus Saccharibacteria bacterium]
MSRWRDGRVVEGARLESVYSSNVIAGSNPVLSAKLVVKNTRHDNTLFKLVLSEN